jgi:hypothetical protein
MRDVIATTQGARRMSSKPKGELVRVLKKLMAADRDDREPYYRAAADRIVALRETFRRPDGLPDWSGGTSAYRAMIQSAYREAGVPPDSEDTVLAALRYHVNNVLREVAPAEQLEAVGLDRASTRQKMRGEAPTRPRKPRPADALPPMPSILAEASQDPVGLVTHAIKALRSAADLKPSGDEAEAIGLLLHVLRDSVDALCATIDQAHR